MQALQSQVEAALQKLTESIPQFGDGQGVGGSQSGLSTALRDFTSSLEGRMSNSPGTTSDHCHLDALPFALQD